MHMADALISPVVGGTMLAATAGLAAYSAKKIRNDQDDKNIPLMGVMGSFVFAAQMINFAIPGTGSSGHLGGGLLLAIVLGPYRGFLAMASVLLIQALFFADGGLLAYGCNVFNLGFFTCFIAYPLFYRPLVKNHSSGGRIWFAAVLAAVAGLQMGSFSVVIETLTSGMSSLPLGSFALLMQPIHFAIGVVEGLVTAAVVSYVWQARPDLLAGADEAVPGVRSKKALPMTLAIAALMIGCFLSWFASPAPDGLEWSLEKAGVEERGASQNGVHTALASLQERTSVLPEYGFKQDTAENAGGDDTKDAWPAVSAGTSVSGVVGGALTMALVALVGFVLSIFRNGRNVSRNR